MISGVSFCGGMSAFRSFHGSAFGPVKKVRGRGGFGYSLEVAGWYVTVSGWQRRAAIASSKLPPFRPGPFENRGTCSKIPMQYSNHVKVKAA
jgi:hypothetical protein